ncbi:MAG: MutS2 family protein [Acidobacteria bacterium]|nr:MutS2 family protein [Acidobacteriota bacterium]
MNDQSFTILEYAELLALVQRGAQTPMGRARIASLQPLTDLEKLRQSLAAVSEYVELRQRGAVWSFAELSDTGESLARLRIAGTGLEPLAILELARLCERALAARAAILAEREVAPVIWAQLANLPGELNSLVARIRNKILPSGELDDRASPELARVRHEIARLRSNITRTLENLMRRSEEAIQDELVTVRNDRFVIPVRSDHRGRVQGVAHGFSSSGATTFVEPLETIEANNELQSLREVELQEIAKILFALAEELRANLPALEMAASAIAELDFIGAKAAFHQRFNCVVPEIGAESDKLQFVADAREMSFPTGDDKLKFVGQELRDHLELIEARHPLLEENLRAVGGFVVPISFFLGAEKSTMVISGANAGGKTVVLKTAGLLSLMALSGLPVPARAARVPFYVSVLADIGDHQSLAANLSTFTSHVANISRMIELCEAPALVLLDEVGTGTDPEEGSALGVAVVDHFRRTCGAHVMATTHYAGLKMYATNDEGVLNASVEFDEKTLRPTYKLLVGLAGSSSGLEIARRFGIPSQIIDRATAEVKDSSRNAAEYLRRIKGEAESAAAQRLALEEERAAVAEKFATLDRQADRRELERQTTFQRECQKTIGELEKQSRELIATIQDRSTRLKLERESQRRVAEMKREANRAADVGGRRVSSAGKPEKSDDARGIRVMREGTVVPGAGAKAAPIARSGSPDDERYVAAEPRPLAVGDRVRLRSFGSIGIVDNIKEDEVEVRVKSLHLREKLENLELVEPAPTETRRAQKLRISRGTEVKLAVSAEAARSELNVIGQTTDEAVDAVDKFLDAASLNNLSELRIIHGHGTGALRRAIADLLAGHPHVARFAPAPPGKGGGGATVVELKE